MISVQGLTKRYGAERLALDDVHFTLRPGLTGLLGPNGAGKSTLMRTLATLQPADGGTIRWTLPHGATLSLPDDADAWRARLGYLPQDFGLWPTVTVAEAVDHFAALKGWPARGARRAIVEAQLAAVGLEARAGDRVDALSGGMRQRVGLAIALLGAPALVIIDEPTAGLDPDERTRLLNLLAELARTAIVLLSTHLVEDVEALCERVLLLDAGRIVVDADPREAVAALRGRVWEGTVEEAALAAWRRDPTLLRERLVARRPVLRVLADRAPAPGFIAVPPTLDDVYAQRGHGRPAAP